MTHAYVIARIRLALAEGSIRGHAQMVQAVDAELLALEAAMRGDLAGSAGVPHSVGVAPGQPTAPSSPAPTFEDGLRDAADAREDEARLDWLERFGLASVPDDADTNVAAVVRYHRQYGNSEWLVDRSATAPSCVGGTVREAIDEAIDAARRAP